MFVTTSTSTQTVPVTFALTYASTSTYVFKQAPMNAVTVTPANKYEATITYAPTLASTYASVLVLPYACVLMITYASTST